ncbi:MAG: hypothetical protein AB1916_13530, partial [Thermodesulfobacteriota bacterium]
DDSGSGLPKVSSARERLALIRRAKSELEAQARARAQEQEERREERETGRKKRGRKPRPATERVADEARANLRACPTNGKT